MRTMQVIVLCLLAACGEVQSEDGSAASDASADDSDQGGDDAPDGEADAGEGQDGAVTDGGATGELTFVNESSNRFYELRLALPASDSFGPNLAPAGGIPPYTTVTVEVECGLHDVRAVDNTGFDCTVYEVETCGAELRFDDSLVCPNS
jgi:hypothetical protein